MCDYREELVLKAEPGEGKINITLDAYGVWNLFTDEEKDEIMRDTAHWDIIHAALRYELKDGFATESFNYTLHQLRLMLCTDEGLVGGMIKQLMSSLIKEVAVAKQKQRKAERAYYDLRKQVPYSITDNAKTPSDYLDERAEDRYDFPSIYSRDIKEETVEMLNQMVKEFFDESIQEE